MKAIMLGLLEASKRSLDQIIIKVTFFVLFNRPKGQQWLLSLLWMWWKKSRTAIYTFNYCSVQRCLFSCRIVTIGCFFGSLLYGRLCIGSQYILIYCSVSSYLIIKPFTIQYIQIDRQRDTHMYVCGFESNKNKGTDQKGQCNSFVMIMTHESQPLVQHQIYYPKILTLCFVKFTQNHKDRKEFKNKIQMFSRRFD